MNDLTNAKKQQVINFVKQLQVAPPAVLSARYASEEYFPLTEKEAIIYYYGGEPGVLDGLFALIWWAWIGFGRWEHDLKARGLVPKPQTLMEQLRAWW